MTIKVSPDFSEIFCNKCNNEKNNEKNNYDLRVLLNNDNNEKINYK